MTFNLGFIDGNKKHSDTTNVRWEKCVNGNIVEFLATAIHCHTKQIKNFFVKTTEQKVMNYKQ